jgi:hypothetical protein
MNIQSQKISLAKMILETDNPILLESIQQIFIKAKKTDFWETLSEEQKEEIDRGLADIVSDNTVEYESVMKEHRK